jgi:hypothetical protein
MSGPPTVADTVDDVAGDRDPLGSPGALAGVVDPRERLQGDRLGDVR